MAIETVAAHASLSPFPAEHLAALIDNWVAVTRTEPSFDDIEALVAVLMSADSEGSAAGFVSQLLPLGLADLVDDPGVSHDARELDRMRTALGEGGSLESLTVRELGDRARAAGRVMASTNHGIKGLEFDVVLLCDCEEGKLPHFASLNASNADAAIREDRRKFYVSITRARKRVHVLHATKRISAAGNPYSVKRSRFVDDLIAG
jgi:DNA helicase-2/ATP-dependent DNA helicase PcrA